jgi:hypothetical protein
VKLTSQVLSYAGRAFRVYLHSQQPSRRELLAGCRASARWQLSIIATDSGSVPAALRLPSTEILQALRSGLVPQAALGHLLDLLAYTPANEEGLPYRIWQLGGADWLAALAGLKAELRYAAMLAASQSEALRLRCPLERWLQVMKHVGDMRGDLPWQWWFQGLVRGASPEYLLSVTRLARRLGQSCAEVCPEPAGTFAPDVRSLMVLHHHGADARETLRLLSRCHSSHKLLPQLAAWHRYQDELISLVWNCSDESQEWWRQHEGSVTDRLAWTMVRLSKVRPDHRVNWLRVLRNLSPDYALHMDASQWCSLMDLALSFTESDCLPSRLPGLLGRWMSAQRSAEGLQQMSQPWLKRIAASLRRNSDWWALDEAIGELSKDAACLLRESLLLQPAAWTVTVRYLGRLGRQRLARVFRVAQEHPLFDPVCCDSTAGLQSLVELMKCQWRERCGVNPITSRILKHLQGVRPLKAQLLQFDIQALMSARARAQLSLIHELAERELRLSFTAVPAKAAITEHTLLMATTVSDNRRAARRLIQSASINGASVWNNHPANLAWFAKLPARAAQGWQQGMRRLVKHPHTGKPLILNLETDPQEVLRMGTVVGSCLSVDCWNSYSAVANAVDANKRVIYARSKDGTIIARQLVAITDEHMLACYSPYPNDLSQSMSQLFRRYDQLLAKHLGLALHQDYHASVPTLVAKDWYDDGVWVPDAA